jgi:hypothetical protein
MIRGRNNNMTISTAEAVLLEAAEPAIRYKALAALKGPDAPETRRARAEIPRSPIVLGLLAERDPEGRLHYHPYAKWQGAHWTLAALADIGYPPGDESLRPLLEQVYAWLFGQSHRSKIKAIDGRTRRCASQEGNALFAALSLGLADERANRLAADLIGWQWPDGGWNCDKNPSADSSSFMESLIPLRALAHHARQTGSEASRAAAGRAAGVFLSRELFKRRSDGTIIYPDFVRLHYPCYWHYDILFGLKVIAEAGFLDDPRCAAALDLLESKRLPNGGFPAEAKYYHLGGAQPSNRSPVDWGGVSARQMNPWVTADALGVLAAAGRVT